MVYCSYNAMLRPPVREICLDLFEDFYHNRKPFGSLPVKLSYTNITIQTRSFQASRENSCGNGGLLLLKHHPRLKRKNPTAL